MTVIGKSRCDGHLDADDECRILMDPRATIMLRDVDHARLHKNEANWRL